MGHFLRRSELRTGIEALVRSSARRALAVCRFGDDALGYFTQRLRAALTRRAAATAVRQAKRNKAFDNCRFIGLAVDGTGVARSLEKVCCWCRPHRNQKQEIVGYHHRVVLVSVVGTGLTLPLDVEPYGPKDSEYNAGRRLLRRVVAKRSDRLFMLAAGLKQKAGSHQVRIGPTANECHSRNREKHCRPAASMTITTSIILRSAKGPRLMGPRLPSPTPCGDPEVYLYDWYAVPHQ